MMTLSILAMVMAGGEGMRLHPLTTERAKPAVPFASDYRVVDFALSNLINSEIQSIYLLVQYKSQSLIRHINRVWPSSNEIPGRFVTAVVPQIGEGTGRFRGTADAVFQNRNLIRRHRPDLVAVFGADHVYRMDMRQMAQDHVERGAEVTVAALPQPINIGSSFGIVSVNENNRVIGFEEKPMHPRPMPERPEFCLMSMGNYLFNTDVLLSALAEADRFGGTDFGRDIFPHILEKHRVFAYDFANNEVPGTHSYEESAYWRDVGTIDAYHAANMDTLGVKPRFNLYNPLWTINSSVFQGRASHIVDGHICNSSFGAGTIVQGATIRNSIIRAGVLIEPDVVIEDSIIMDHTVICRGARLRRTIVDRDNEIERDASIGYHSASRQSGTHVTDSGITVISKGSCQSSVHCY